jgi:hypothetical protein
MLNIKKILYDEQSKTYKPKVKYELQKLLKVLIRERGPKGNFNDIDVSEIKDMSHLFKEIDYFEGDISQWDVSNVIDATSMLQCISYPNPKTGLPIGKGFQSDISQWNFASLEYAENIFDKRTDKDKLPNIKVEKEDKSPTFQPKVKSELRNLLIHLIKKNSPKSYYNDIDTSLINDMSGLFLEIIDFLGDGFEGEISNWDVSNVIDMREMFYATPFNNNISSWNMSNVRYTDSMFKYSEFNRSICNWDLSNLISASFMFANSYFKQDLSSFDFTGVCTKGMFYENRIEKYLLPLGLQIDALDNFYEIGELKWETISCF